jgi:hypothetical protein
MDARVCDGPTQLDAIVTSPRVSGSSRARRERERGGGRRLERWSRRRARE